MPFAGHTPIHPRWSEHHRPVATGTQTGTCTITRDSADGTLDDDNVWHPPSATTIYVGSCRVTPHSVTGARVQVVADQPVGTSAYEVTIEWDAAEVREHDIVTIGSAQDPRLAGRKLRVTDIPLSSESFERVLICSEDLTRREA